MQYNLYITYSAEKDLIKISDYIENSLHSKKAASEFVDEVIKKITSLQSMPEIYPLVSDENLANKGIRKIPIKNYLVFYTIDIENSQINIVRILYSKRDWLKLL